MGTDHSLCRSEDVGEQIADGRSGIGGRDQMHETVAWDNIHTLIAAFP